MSPNETFEEALPSADATDETVAFVKVAVDFLVLFVYPFQCLFLLLHRLEAVVHVLNDLVAVALNSIRRIHGLGVNAFELAARSGDDRVVDAAFAASPVGDEEKKAAGAAARERSLASALFAAARVGDARAARRAAEALGDVSAKHPLALERHDGGGKTVLETAAGRGAAGVIRALLAARASGAGLAPREPGEARDGAGAMAWAAYARSDEAVEAVLAAGVTAGGEWAAASRVAETRGASMRVRRVLRGRAGRGTA